MSEPIDFARVAAEAEAVGFPIGEFGVPRTLPDDEQPAPKPSTEEPPKRGRGRPRKTTPGAAPPPAPKSPPLPPYTEGMFVETLEKLYMYAGMGLMLADPICATAVIKSAHECAVALDKMTKNNRALRRMFFALMQTSDLTAVVVAHLPILAAVIFHHVPSARNMLTAMGLRFDPTEPFPAQDDEESRAA